VLPGVLRPLANSASGWTVPTALLVWALRERAVVSAVLGVLGYESLLLGYVAVSNLRGFPDQETQLLVVGLLGGAVVGVAAAWLHESGPRCAMGAGVLAGILLADASWGLLAVLPTTGGPYWAVVGVVGLALLVVAVLGRRLRPREVVLSLATVLGVMLTFFTAYSLLS
jgi:hypothetical protein